LLKGSSQGCGGGRAVASDGIEPPNPRSGLFNSDPFSSLQSVELALIAPCCSRILRLSLFCPRPLSTEDATTAALFRIIPKYHPTVFFDEFDTLGDKGDDYRAILNASHRRNGKVLRTVPVGDGFEVRAFSVSCPIVVIGIGTVYDTLLASTFP
jgi:hypothetical protein